MCSECRGWVSSAWLREVLRLERAHAFCMVHCLETAPLLLMHLVSMKSQKACLLGLASTS